MSKKILMADGGCKTIMMNPFLIGWVREIMYLRLKTILNCKECLLSVILIHNLVVLNVSVDFKIVLRNGVRSIQLERELQGHYN